MRTINRFTRQHRISDSDNKIGLVNKQFYCKRSRFTDGEDEDNIISSPVVDEELDALTEEEIAGLREILPYIPALKKIAKGEFEIERVEEDDEDEEVAGDEETKEVSGDADFEEDVDMDADSEDVEEDTETEDEPVEDSIDQIWAKRLAGNETK